MPVLSQVTSTPGEQVIGTALLQVRGLTVSTTGAAPLILQAVDGWLDLQGVESDDTAKTNADGSWSGVDYNPSRVVEVGILIAPLDKGGWTFSEAVAALETATQVTRYPVPVKLTLPGRDEETIYAKIRRRLIPTLDEFMAGLSEASVQFFAPDPRRFAAPVTETTPLPSSVGGLTWPVTFPIMSDAVQTTGFVSITNPGNTTGPVTLRIYGPCQQPIVTHLASGESLAFASDLVIAAGDWIDVDMEAHTVLANGQASRAASVVRRGWFGLEPGENLISFNAGGPDPAALLEVTGTPAWQ